MLRRRRVVVVVPAYREEAHIADVIRTMPRFVDRILVVDDGSNDATSEVARSVDDPRVRVLRHPLRRGVGAAIATGYRAALEIADGERDAIAVMAGDGQMHPDDLEGVVTPIVDGLADYVKGDRFGEAGVRQAMGFPRWLGGQVFSRLTSLAVGQPISDSQCGFTAIGRGILGAIDLEGLWPSFGYPNDILGQLAARRGRIREVAVRPLYGTEISKLRLRHLPPIFFLIARAAARQRGPAVPRSDDNRRDRGTGGGAPLPRAEGPRPRNDDKPRDRGTGGGAPLPRAEGPLPRNDDKPRDRQAERSGDRGRSPVASSRRREIKEGVARRLCRIILRNGCEHPDRRRVLP